MVERCTNTLCCARYCLSSVITNQPCSTWEHQNTTKLSLEGLNCTLGIPKNINQKNKILLSEACCLIRDPRTTGQFRNEMWELGADITSHKSVCSDCWGGRSASLCLISAIKEMQVGNNMCWGTLPAGINLIMRRGEKP